MQAFFAGLFCWGCETEFFAFPVGQSCCSALKSWAARQRRPTRDVKIFVMRPFAGLLKKPIGPRDLPSPMGARQPFEPTTLCHLNHKSYFFTLIYLDSP
ncbi:MAG: hypothetical protein ABSC18_05810 [Verrucomicrobiota bacterium]|jgi:hypothetical protein